MNLKDQIVYDIDMTYEDKNGYHIYSHEYGHTISMCPIFILKNHPNFNEFVEYFIRCQLCERICLESRIHKTKSKYKCSEKYCPMEVPALLMLGMYIEGEYYLFNPLNYEIVISIKDEDLFELFGALGVSKERLIEIIKKGVE